MGLKREDVIESTARFRGLTREIKLSTMGKKSERENEKISAAENFAEV